MPHQLIDSHVHLFELDHLQSLSWMTPKNPLQGQHSVGEYVTSTQCRSNLLDTSKDPRRLLGFIFIEVDRIKNPPSQIEGWKSALEEYSFVASISLGLIPKYIKYSSLLLGIIPWGPLPFGCLAMQQYERKLCSLHSEPITVNGFQRPYKVKGFRHLLQDEPRRTMLGARFLESLRWMGRQGYVFECTINNRVSQLWQLEEVIEMMKRVNRQVARDEDLVQVVVDHLSKPSFTIDPTSSAESYAYHKEYISLVDELSQFPNVAMKFSGAFSKLPDYFHRLPTYPKDASPSDEATERWIDEVANCVSPWTNRIYKCFGAKRVLWGSDWPVCNMVGGKEAFGLWERITERLLRDAGISDCDQEGFWWENAKRIYKIKADERESSRI